MQGAWRWCVQFSFFPPAWPCSWRPRLRSPTLFFSCFYQGETFELKWSNRVIARLTPARPASPLRAEDLPRFLADQADLADDGEGFARDIAPIRSGTPPELDPWA